MTTVTAPPSAGAFPPFLTGHAKRRRAGAMRVAAIAAFAATAVAPAPLAAQTAPDTLTLGRLQRRAEAHDPRAAERALLTRQRALRIEALRRERLPALGGTASAQYLSDVASVAVPGRPQVGPPNDQVDAYVGLRTPLVDPARGARIRAERARTDEALAGVRSALWQQRFAVHDAFFEVLTREAEARQLAAAREDVVARRGAAALRVDAGAALPGTVAALDAEAVRLSQGIAAVEADARAARAQLAALTGVPIPDDLVLRAPAGNEGALPAPARDRPEFAQFARTRDRLAAQQRVLAAQRRPRLVLNSRAGYGRPGLNALQRDFDTYWLAGVAVEWTPFAWGRRARETEALALDARIAEQREASLAAAIARAADRQRATLDALVANLAGDDTIIALRTRIVEEARRLVDVGELPTTEFVARRTELLQATLDRDRRRLRIADVRARYLTLIGREVP